MHCHMLSKDSGPPHGNNNGDAGGLRWCNFEDSLASLKDEHLLGKKRTVTLPASHAVPTMNRCLKLGQIKSNPEQAMESGSHQEFYCSFIHQPLKWEWSGH
ncbi:uncharacterized [Tachysurus ichikawai]